MLNLKRIESVLLFLTILFLPTQLGRHFWPEFSFVYSLPVDYLSPTIYFWDLLVILLCLIFVFSGRHINRVALNLFFLFLLSQTFSLMTNLANIGVGLIRLEQYLIAGLFGVYLASSKKNPIELTIFWGFAVAICFESILAIGQFLKNGTLGLWVLGERTFSISNAGISKFDYYGREFLRPYATFPHPNVLAGFMVVGIVILNSVIPKKQFTITLRVATILAATAVLLTVSRVAIICGLVFITTVLTKNRHRVLLILAVIILLPVLYTRFSSLLNFDNLAYTRREELSGIAMRIWMAYPVFGAGLNNFIPTASDLLLSGPSRFLQPVHDIFLLVLSETGLVGFTGFMIFLGYPLFRLFRLKSKPVHSYPILSLWVIIIFLGLFDHYFLTLPQGYRLLFFVWGLSLRMLE